MINLPPVNITPASRTSTTQKTKRKAYATEPEREPEQKQFTRDRRSSSNRRQRGTGEQVIDRRTGQDRRKGRINLVI